ncbi:MAG TPA: deaminase [Candidatus Paceibacterota bacterium]|nr:deaminase [Candidatus Paceibacterota bacterium]
MPVLHQGYLQLIDRVAPDKIYLVGDSLLQDVPGELEYVRRKDRIRAIPVKALQYALVALLKKTRVHVPFVGIADAFVLSTLEDSRVLRLTIVVMPEEDVSQHLAQKYFGGNVRFEKMFLRWDRTAVSAQETIESVTGVPVSLDLLDRVFMEEAEQEAEKSLDWWRQIGAALVKDGKVIFTAHNTHVPHPDAPNVFGDPRSLFKRGIRIECSSAEHAEAHVIAEAAKCGISTRGADLYVTAFPCPQCAILIAHAGISRCFFASGYSVLHGASVMQDEGVELIYVDMKAPHE